MHDALIQSKLISTLRKCQKPILIEWTDCISEMPEFKSGVVHAHIKEMLEKLLEDVILTIEGNTPLAFTHYPCPTPVEKGQVEFDFLFAAEHSLMNILFNLFDFGVSDWMKIRALANHAFHQIARSRIDQHCAHCRLAMDEDTMCAHRIEVELQEHLHEKDPI